MTDTGNDKDGKNDDKEEKNEGEGMNMDEVE